jgi:hypothetical protein
MKLIIRDIKTIIDKLEKLSSSLTQENSAEDSIKVINFIYDGGKYYLMTTNRVTYIKVELDCEIDGEPLDFVVSYQDLKKELSYFKSLKYSTLSKIELEPLEKLLKITSYEEIINPFFGETEDKIAKSTTNIKVKPIIGNTKELYEELRLNNASMHKKAELKEIINTFTTWTKVQSMKRGKVFFLEDYSYCIVGNIFAYINKNQVPSYLQNKSISFQTILIFDKLLGEPVEDIGIEIEDYKQAKTNQIGTQKCKMRIDNYTIMFDIDNLKVKPYEDMTEYFIDDGVSIQVDKGLLHEMVQRYSMKEIIKVSINSNEMVLKGDEGKIQKLPVKQVGKTVGNITFKITATIFNQMLVKEVKGKILEIIYKELNETKARIMAYLNDDKTILSLLSFVEI